jgi:hypothetical protein
MRLDTNLLNNVYRIDPYFKILKEVYDKWKNHHRKDKHIADSQRDITLLRLKKDFIKIPNILINQLTEINFSCKECFKLFIVMYKFTLTRNTMTFKCKKEYLRKMIKMHRNSFNVALKELKEKNMLLMEKENGYFYFTLNLCFLNWNLPEHEMEKIRENNENEIKRYQEKYIDEEEIL